MIAFGAWVYNVKLLGAFGTGAIALKAVHTCQVDVSLDMTGCASKQSGSSRCLV